MRLPDFMVPVLVICHELLLFSILLAQPGLMSRYKVKIKSSIDFNNPLGVELFSNPSNLQKVALL